MLGYVFILADSFRTGKEVNKRERRDSQKSAGHKNKEQPGYNTERMERKSERMGKEIRWTGKVAMHGGNYHCSLGGLNRGQNPV